MAKYGLTTDTYEQLLQDCSNKAQKIIDVDWSELCDKYDLGVHYDTLRKSSQFITGGAFVSEYFKWKNSKASHPSSYSDELELQKIELQKERNKLSTEKLELNRWLREYARDELIADKICDAVRELPALEVPMPLKPTHGEKSFLLAYGDEHVGVEFEIKDLFGRTINSYSPEEFERRMWSMFHQVIKLIEKEGITTLNIFSMGDYTDGCLRVSQLMKLRYGVVEGTIYYANFITTWLNELSKYVYIKYHQTDGNHSELRMLGQPKSTFKEDNMGKVIAEFIKVRLDNNPNLVFVENPTGYMYAELSGYSVMGFHGETKNMEKTLKDFSVIYGIPIDYLIAGHLHHSKTEEIASCSEVINIPSVIATDPYALSLSKTSDPSAKLLVFESGRGKVCEYTLKLN